MTQQTWNVGPTLVYCLPDVYDAGPTVNQRWANVSWIYTHEFIRMTLRLQNTEKSCMSHTLYVERVLFGVPRGSCALIVI